MEEATIKIITRHTFHAFSLFEISTALEILKIHIYIGGFFISQELGRFHRNSITIAKLELMGITEIAERVCDCIMLGDYEYGSPRAQQSGICFMKIKCYFSYCTDFIHNDV